MIVINLGEHFKMAVANLILFPHYPLLWCLMETGESVLKNHIPDLEISSFPASHFLLPITL